MFTIYFILRDGARESHIVTKCFEVEKCENNQDDLKEQQNAVEYKYIDDLERERKKVFNFIYLLLRGLGLALNPRLLIFVLVSSRVNSSTDL